jgi:peroxiredoxin family protein
MSNIQVLIPTIKWSQNSIYVIINLEINQVKNDVYELNSNNIVFSGTSNTNLQYSINLELLNSIDTESSKYIVEERIIRFILKKSIDEKWIRLTKDKAQYKSNIKVNWNDFEDSEGEEGEEEEEKSLGQNFNQQNPNQQFDLSSMMNMGNNNQFNMEEMMKNMDPNEMEELMKSMSGNNDYSNDDNDDGDNDNDDDDNNDDNDSNDDDDDSNDNNDDDDDSNDNNDDDDDSNHEFNDKILEAELDNIINNREEELIDFDDLCQECK